MMNTNYDINKLYLKKFFLGWKKGLKKYYLYIIMEMLPEEIFNNIMLYNSHKTADMMRVFNKCYNEYLHNRGADVPYWEYEEEDYWEYLEIQETTKNKTQYVKDFNWLVNNRIKDITNKVK